MRGAKHITSRKLTVFPYFSLLVDLGAGSLPTQIIGTAAAADHNEESPSTILAKGQLGENGLLLQDQPNRWNSLNMQSSSYQCSKFMTQLRLQFTSVSGASRLALGIL